MENDNIELSQYGHLASGGDDAQDLLKAMQAGQITGRDTTNQALTAEPLKLESLESTLRVLDFRLQDIKLLNDVPKMVATNTVEEFLQLKSYGTQRGGFYNEGELSDVEDSVYVRRSELIKYVQVTGEVTVQAQIVKSFIDVQKKEVENKTMWIQRAVNTALTKGDSNIIPQEFNGYYKQHQNIGSGGDYLYANLNDYYNSEVVVDLRGKSLTQFDVEKGAVTLDSNFANVSDLYAPTSVVSALMQDYFGDQRIVMPTTGFNGIIGTNPTGIATSVNPNVKLKTDKFMKTNPARLIATAATSAKAPNAPTASGTVPALAADTNAKFVAGEAGTVYYGVTALNRYGESALTLLDATPITVTVGSAIDVQFTATAGVYAATGYRIYRTKVTAAGTATNEKFYPLFDVSTSELAAGYDGAAATKVRDRGRIMPGMETAFLVEMAEEILSFKQLAPVSKLDLAIVSMSRRFIVFNFCTPQLYAPKKLLKFINVSPVLNP